MLSLRRVAAILCVAALSAVSALTAPAAATASTTTTTSGSSTTARSSTVATVPKATTTTSPAPQPTTTTRPAPKPTTTTTRPAPKPATTTSTPTTTATLPARPRAGVPSVPVAGPPTTPPAKGTNPARVIPVQPSATPILSAVDQNLAQLQAINDYLPAQQHVARARQEVTVAGAALLSARRALTAARYVQALERSSLEDADAKLRDLALAAYMGVGYASPTAGPQGENGRSPGTVSSPGGLTGLAAVDANEMIVLVAQKARSDVADAKHHVTLAAKVVGRAQATYAAAQKRSAAAEAALVSSQQTLELITKAATTPGVATAVSLPTFVTADSASSPYSTASSTTAGTTATTTSPGSAALTNLRAVAGTTPRSPDILGRPVMDGADLAAWFASTGRKANVTVPMSQLAQDYQKAGQATGVRYDLAFAQSVVETGSFSFPSYGQLTSHDNNFAGIGACDTCAHGWSFPTAAQGVGAQLELLDAYASAHPVDTRLLGHGGVGVGGCCRTWMALAGVWASSTVYGISIMTIYNQMLTWFIPRQLVQVGLAKPARPAKGTSPAPPPRSTRTAAAAPKTSTGAAPAKVRAAPRKPGG